MNLEAINELLKEFAVPQTLSDALLGKGETPEDFDVKAAIAAHAKERESFFIEKNTPVILESYKKETNEANYLDIVNPIRGKAAKEFGLTKEEIEGMDVKQVIAFAAQKAKQAAESTADKSVEQYVKDLNQTKEERLQLQQERDALLADIEATKNSFAKQAADEIKAYKVDNKFMGLLDSDSIDFDPTNKKIRADILRLKMREHGYKLDIAEDGRLKPVSLDGTTAYTIDGKGKYEDALALVRDLSSEYGLIRRSNGGQDHTPSIGKLVQNGKEVSTGGLDFLKQAVGV